MKGVVGAIVVVALLLWRRVRRRSASTPHRSLVNEYRRAENSSYVLGYLVLLVVIGILLLLRRAME
jgi:hypothetical protein